jgi:hypothetical protein
MNANSFNSPGELGGNLESIQDKLTILEPEDCPWTSTVKKTSASATFTEVVADVLRKPRITGSREGKPAQGGNNKAKNRKRFGAHAHRFFDEWGVTDTQQAVSRKGGNAVTDNEYGDAKAKTLREIKRDIEAACLSNQETQGGSEDEMRMRGYFKWVQAGAQNPHPVPELFRPPAGNILSGYGTTVSLFTEAQFNGVLKSAKQVYGGKRTYDCHAGDNVIETVDRFTRVQESATNSRYQVYEQMTGKERTISLMVTVFDSSFGRVNMIPNQFVRWDTANEMGDANAAALAAIEYWELQVLEELLTKDEGDHGGGESGWIRGQMASMCANPKGQGAFYNT